ncbi:MAG: phosphatidate cytidylyltransferase [Chloroflexota bacterium]
MLKTRVITAFFLIPLILGSVYLGGLVFFALVTLALLFAGDEFFKMARGVGYRTMPVIGWALIALFAWNAFDPADYFRPILAGVIILTLVLGVFRHTDGWLAGWAITLAGALYVGGLGAYFLLVRNLPNGTIWTTAALVTAWMTDTGAYLAGTRLGRHKFFPLISPKKTWEGAIGGWVAAPLTFVALGWLFSLPPDHCAMLGFLIGIAATFGDLAESLIKRQTGVKDSSNIVPGHGGILDRLDSLLFTAVVTYYYLVWVLRV